MFKNRTIIISGAASGVGACTAIKFAEKGCNVALIDIDDEKGKALQAAINSKNGNSIYYHCDVSISEDIKHTVRKIIEDMGRIDLLVNNAAIQTEHNFFDLQEDVWRKVLDINLTGTFLFTQIAAKEMSAGGNIININSIHYEIPRLNKFHYDASKAGVAMLTKETALALAPYGIRVNGVAAGAVITPMNFDWLSDPDKVEKTKNKIPLGRLSTVEDVVNVILFLASKESDYITGTIISVDGGKSLT